MGFEPTRRSHDLPVFKTGPFNHLGTPPYILKASHLFGISGILPTGCVGIYLPPFTTYTTVGFGVSEQTRTADLQGHNLAF